MAALQKAARAQPMARVTFTADFLLEKRAGKMKRAVLEAETDFGLGENLSLEKQIGNTPP